MIVFEAKLEGTQEQYGRLDQAIRTGRFVRNSVIRAWLDKEVKSRNDAYKYCKVLADNPEFPWAKKLNSMARQAHAERAWASIERFYRNCRAKIKGKKRCDPASPSGANASSFKSGNPPNGLAWERAPRQGFPKFAKYKVRASVEYKTSGWKLSESRRYLKFTDGFKAGNFKLWGSRDLHFYQLAQIKRVRVVRRHDGYYAQFLIDEERRIEKELTGVQRGLDVGLNHFYTDNFGEKVDNPRFLRKDERKLQKLQRRLSRTQKGSKNRAKARNRLGRAHLLVSRRRNDWVCKLAQHVIRSSDLIAVENLKVRNMVKNHKLAKSINDVSWYRFREWLEYFGAVYGVPVIAVNPSYTSIKCSNCGEPVVKTLSTRTHSCHTCGYVADRDENAAKNILHTSLKQLSDTVGRTEIHNASGENDLCLDVETQPSKPTRRKRKPL
ncbi:MAG: transposase [Xenococcaceae cyanobacterium MO_167.B27]|nr:transposase [Xenococcaceae cyanobacterium MO_167.B27]